MPCAEKSKAQSKAIKHLLELLHYHKTQREAQRAVYNWPLVARPNQLPPPEPWNIWLILAGRGFGKTRTGAETVRQWANQGGYRRICLLGNSLDDVRSVMLQGQSGLLTVSPPWEKPRYYPSRHKVVWPNGAEASAYSAAAYEKLRGPQFDAAWIDELGKFTNAQETWDQLMLSLRLGTAPKIIITTTPRPTPLIKALMQRPDVVMTRGSTMDNAQHLSPDYIAKLNRSYGNSDLWQQEVQGLLVESQETGLWKRHMFLYERSVRELERIVVAIDPAVTSKKHSDETGIIVAGVDSAGYGYILEDLSGHYTPTQWINKAVEAYHQYAADRIIAEINNGGDVVQHLLHSLHSHIPYKGVNATRSKFIRAEPIAALYEDGKIFHTQPFSMLEHQLVSPSSYKSPDRMDALVWALTELFLNHKGDAFAEIL